MPPPYQSDYRALALIGTAVGEMVVPILIGVWLDDRYGWSPYGMAIGAVLGVVGGTAHLIVISRQMGRNRSTK